MNDFFHTVCSDLATLCRGKPSEISSWLEPENSRKLISCLFWIVLGSGSFGFAVGIWRAPMQALFVAIKLPILILLTTLGNGLLNGALAQLLGLPLGFRQSLTAVLMSFSVASIILGALSPLLFFMILNLPEVRDTGNINRSYGAIILSAVLVISFAGTTSNLHLHRLVEHAGRSKPLASRIILAWLAVNLLLGGQLSWIMRPFIGTPDAPIEFLREAAFDGNFFETVWRVTLSFLQGG